MFKGIQCWIVAGALVAGLASAAYGAGDDVGASGGPEDVSMANQGATWSPNEVTGQIDLQTTSQGNRCLYDPLGAIRSLRQRGDITGFNRPPDGFGVGYPDPEDDEWHWQGVQRLSPVLRGKAEDDSAARYMIVSSSQPYFDADKPETTGPHFAVVYMGSRDQGGLRWRSPRLGPDTPDWDYPPFGSDFLIHNRAAEDVDHAQDYNHASSIQVMGDYLFQPLERYNGGEEPSSSCPTEPSGDCQARIHVYDLSPISDPWVAGSTPKFKFSMRTQDKGASAVAVARLAPIKGETASRILMVVAGGAGGSRNLEFYVTDPGATLDTTSNPFTWVATLDLYDETHAGFPWPWFAPWRQNWSDYQNIGLVTACETLSAKLPGGQLYLLGMTRNHSGDDVVDAFELNLTLSGGIWTANLQTNGTSDGPAAHRHLYCDEADISGENQCHFDAGAGAYVDPRGRLYVYATEHDNDGPVESVKMMEFRPEDHLDDPGTAAVEACDNIEDAWVELYDNKIFANDGSQPSGFLPAFSTPLSPPHSCCEGNARGGYPSSRVGLMIDWVDRHARSYEDFQVAYNWSSATGATDAARWCVPRAYKYVAFYGTKYSGAIGYEVLDGSGQITGYNFSSTAALRSGCFMHADTPVDTSGASNEGSCL